MTEFERGMELEARAQELLAAARAAYQRSFDAHSLDGLHALVRLAVADGRYGQAQVLLGYVTSYRAEDPSGALVSVAPDVLGEGISLDGDDEGDPDNAGSFVIIAESFEAAAAAVTRVAPDLLAVDEHGRVWEPGVIPDAYTPNFLFDTEVCNHGALVSLDTKDTMTSAMGRTMVGMLVDALVQDGIPAHVTSYRPDLRSEWFQWEPTG